MGVDQYDMRRFLLHKEDTITLVDFFLDKNMEEMGDDEEASRSLYDSLQRKAAHHNVEMIYRYAESEIEKIFLNSLHLGFIKSSPLGFHITRPYKDAPGAMEGKRRFDAGLVAAFKDYAQYAQNPSVDGFRACLDAMAKDGVMQLEERSLADTHVIIRPFTFNALHLTPQAGFPNIRVAGRSIRVDMLFWIPARDSFRLVVECDGFQYHSDKEKFTSDRARDRLLKASGYDVLRYSGSEIVRDPHKAAIELIEYLFNTVSWGEGCTPEDPFYPV